MAWALHTVPGSVREALGHVGRRRTTLLVGGARKTKFTLSSPARKSDGTTTATSDVKGGSTVARETLRALRYKHTSTVVCFAPSDSAERERTTSCQHQASRQHRTSSRPSLRRPTTTLPHSAKDWIATARDRRPPIHPRSHHAPRPQSMTCHAVCSSRHVSCLVIASHARSRHGLGRQNRKATGTGDSLL